MHVSPSETALLLTKKYFEIQKAPFSYDWVQVYYEGFVILALSDPDFLSLNYYEISLATIFAFLDILDEEEYRLGFFKWLHLFSSFSVVIIYASIWSDPTAQSERRKS